MKKLAVEPKGERKECFDRIFIPPSKSISIPAAVGFGRVLLLFLFLSPTLVLSPWGGFFRNRSAPRGVPGTIRPPRGIGGGTPAGGCASLRIGAALRCRSLPSLCCACCRCRCAPSPSLRSVAVACCLAWWLAACCPSPSGSRGRSGIFRCRLCCVV